MEIDELGRRELALKVQKLELENALLARQAEGLTPESLQHEQLLKFLPLITTVIAVCAFVFSVVQFTESQARDRESKARDREQVTRSQIRADLSELMKYTTDKSKTTANAVYLLTELDVLTKGNQEQRDRITDLIKQIVLYDFEFTDNVTENDIRFDNNAGDYWEDYRTLLENNPIINVRLLRRYFLLYDVQKEKHIFREVLRNAINRHGKRLRRAKTNDYSPEEVKELLDKVATITGKNVE